MARKIHHYPRLDTILMIEEAVRRSKNKGRMEIWRSLPRKIMYQTFLLILGYLEDSGKIINDKGKIIWIHDAELVKRLIELSEYTYKK